MKRFTHILIAAVVCIGLFSTLSMAQTTGDIIENMGVVRVISVEVIPEEESAVHYLNVRVELKNDNEKDVKLQDNEFTFYIQIRDELTNQLQKQIKIGKDVEYPDKDILLKSKQSEIVTFKVEMGRDELSVLETTIHILNFIGDTTAKNRNFFIKGRFDLGIKSSKGWSYGEAVRVEWMFCPTIQEELPLRDCFPEVE